MELVSGVPSFCAAAARLNLSLVEWDEPLHVLPSVHRTDHPLDGDGTYVLMKSGRNMTAVKDLLRKSGREVSAVENCGMETEKIYRTVKDIPDQAGYLSLIIAKNTT